MAINQKNITIASYNYLHEISAIPQETRFQYLKLLSKRKGALSQKNVKLFLIICSYVDDNRIGQWNPSLVCMQTGISMNALYVHKSRLIKGLRAFYFKWAETENEIERNHKISADKFSIESELLELDLKKVRKMSELGMMREAKSMYLHLEKRIRDSATINLTYKYVIISEIYEYAAYYYAFKRNKKKILNYIEKINHAIGVIKVLNLRISKEQEALLSIRVDYCEYYLYCLNWYTNPNAKMVNDFPKRIYDISKKFQNHFYLLKILHGKVIMEIIRGNFEKAKECCIEGYNIAKERKNETSRYTFASMFYFLKTKTQVKNTGLDNESILQYYHVIKKTEPLNLWTTYLENSLAMMYQTEKRKEIKEVLLEQINSNTLFGDHTFAVYWRFVLNAETYNDELLSFFSTENMKEKGFLEMNKVIESLSANIDKTCFNTLCYKKDLSNFGLLWQVYNLQLTNAYFRETDSDHHYRNLIISKMERIKEKADNLKRYELLKLSIKMLKHSNHMKYLVNKFEHKFKKTLDSYRIKGSEFGIMDYAIISSLARRLKCREITAIVKEFYYWLSNNHPEILKPVFREIEEREAKIYTITGKEEAA